MTLSVTASSTAVLMPAVALTTQEEQLAAAGRHALHNSQ
jgi:hypothetical protein